MDLHPRRLTTPSLLRVSDTASRKEDLSLVRPQLHADRRLCATREIFHGRFAASADRRKEVRDPQAVALLDFVVRFRVRERDLRDGRVSGAVDVDPLGTPCEVY